MTEPDAAPLAIDRDVAATLHAILGQLLTTPAVPPRGPQDAPTADGAGPEPEHGAGGPQTGADGAESPDLVVEITADTTALNHALATAADRLSRLTLRQRIAAAIEADAERPRAERVGIVNAVLAEMQPELADRDRLADRAERAEAQVRAARQLAYDYAVGDPTDTVPFHSVARAISRVLDTPPA